MFITARIASIFVCPTAVHIREFHIFTVIYRHFEGLMEPT